MKQAWPSHPEAAAAPDRWMCAVCGNVFKDPDMEAVGALFFIDAAGRERRVEFRVHHACATGIGIDWERVRDHVPVAPAAGGVS